MKDPRLNTRRLPVLCPYHASGLNTADYVESYGAACDGCEAEDRQGDPLPMGSYCD